MKNNNRLYKDIKINLNIENPINDINDQICEQEDHNEYDDLDGSQSILLYNGRNYIINHNYSVINIDNDDCDWNDIEKYSFKKAEFDPLSSRDKDLDHMCFPHLFPFGKGLSRKLHLFNWNLIK